MSTDGSNSTAASLSDLVNVAILKNHEIFTRVVATIKKSVNQKKSDKKGLWQEHVATRVAVSAAKGDDGYCSAEDWVMQFHKPWIEEISNDVYCNNLREALEALPERDCYRKRLQNALDALESSTTKGTVISIKQVVGLIRCSTYVIADGECDDTDAMSIDLQLQARTISHLVKLMPQLASTSPNDIFMAVQLPLLQKIHWDAFINGGIKFESTDVESGFRSLLNLKFDETDNAHVGEKRKRSPDDDAENAKDASSSNIQYLLEAAHLARKGAVRAQHGAVIFISSVDGDETKTKVIGRGWNHDYLLDPSKAKKNKIVLHSEVHAVVDAIQTYGEDKCFEELFPKSTIMIVELKSDYGYDTSHPCPKCDPMLRAVGIPNVLHTTAHGTIKKLDFSPANPRLLSNENVAIPLGAACDEKGITCKRLQKAESAKEK